MDQELQPRPSEPERRAIKMPLRLAILTAGGDAPGMNAAIRSIVRTANGAGIEVIGAKGGFAGLVYGDFMSLTNRSVSNVIQQGGTLLETSRSLNSRRSAEGRALPRICAIASSTD
jgi:6-phosphofructokinase 1